jgi:hypothetical protein
VSAYLCRVAAGQALVAAITGEANRLLSLDLPSLEDGSQLAGRACYYSKVLNRELGTFKGQKRGFQSRG